MTFFSLREATTRSAWRWESSSRSAISRTLSRGCLLMSSTRRCCAGVRFIPTFIPPFIPTSSCGLPPLALVRRLRRVPAPRSSSARRASRWTRPTRRSSSSSSRTLRPSASIAPVRSLSVRPGVSSSPPPRRRRTRRTSLRSRTRRRVSKILHGLELGRDPLRPQGRGGLFS